MRLPRLFDRLRNRTAAFTHDLVMIPCAWLSAYWLRFNLDPVPPEYLSQALSILPVVVLTQGAIFWYFGLYRGVWRFASLPDLVRILRAIVVGTCMAALGIFLLTRMQFVPRSVFPLHAVLLVLLLGGPRLVYRWFKDRNIYSTARRKALIVGAGQAGEMLVRDLLRDRGYGYFPVGFVDDDPAKKGHDIHGVRVLDYCKRIPDLVRRFEVDLVLIAVPSATSREMRRIVELCEAANVPMRTLPPLQDLVSGRSVVRELREIAIEDLLGREPVSLDWSAIEAGVRDRVVLVTGGGGSIGSEKLCRQLGRLGPKRLVVFDSSELNVYQIESELGTTLPPGVFQALLGDVCDPIALAHAFDATRPDLVFHAAAYKHVPILEGQMRAAIRTNVLGTRNVARAAVEASVESFVLISTDKAVNPTNVMGASKRIAEIWCQNLDRRQPQTRFITVRFGNVLDSAGSVVPLFRRQIARGGPVTVTHPEVRRYFMTIPEACQLIMQAGAVGRGGEVFVLDMGEPVRISYLARQMILLSGKVPEEDVEIHYVGLRPGEKLFEELFHESEALTQTGYEKLLLARHREHDWARLGQAVEGLEAACAAYDETRMRALVAELVPEYRVAPADATGNVIPIEKAKR